MYTVTDKKKNINRAVLAGIFLGYLLFNGILLMRHEPWRDEANVWLMARELSPVSLLQEIKYQGHPCLWYLLVMPFARAGLPFRTIGVLSFSIMAAAVAIFLWKAPFHPLVKAICIYSPVFTYFYAVIARNYCQIAFLMILLAWFYPQRNEKCGWYGLLLGLLVQTDTIAIAGAGMISLMWLAENCITAVRTKSFRPVADMLKGFWIPPVSLLFWIAQFYQVSDSPAFQMNRLGGREFLVEVRNYCFRILERMTGREEDFCRLFLLLLLLLLAVLSVRLKSIGAVSVTVAAFLFEAVFSVVVYQLHLWHFIALCFVLIWTVWVLYEQTGKKRPADRISRATLGGLQVLLLLFTVCMFLHWNSEEETSSLDNALHGMYSDGVNTAEFIEKNILADQIIVTANVPMASTVAAYLPDYQFYFAGTGEITFYADYSEKQSSQISFKELLAWAQAKFPERTEFYLLDTEDSCIIEREKLEECEVLYRTEQETARGEEYTLYRVLL